MPKKLKTACCYSGCQELVHGRFCDEHKRADQRAADRQRGSSTARGYNSRWSKYSKWFLRQPENVFCKLQFPGCNNVAQCVDHIDPHDGPTDPRFWEVSNHQPACIRCNSVKGRRTIVGVGKPFEAMTQSDDENEFDS